MAYVAAKPLKIGDSIRQKGELVPEAESWTHLDAWMNAGQIVFVPDEVVSYYIDHPENIANAPYLAIPQADSHLESVYQHKGVAFKHAEANGATDYPEIPGPPFSDGESVEPADEVVKTFDGVVEEKADPSDDETSDDDDDSADADDTGTTALIKEVPDYMEDSAGYHGKTVIQYAKEHPEHAEMLYDSESEGKNRATVLSGLKPIVESAAQE